MLSDAYGGTETESLFDVLGVGLRLASSDARIHSLARDCLMPLAITVAAPLSLRIDVARDPAPGLPPDPEFRVSGRCFAIRTPIGEGSADQDSGEARAKVTVESGELRDLQTAFIETLAVFLAYGRRPIALHCAVLVSGGRGVLITAPEGAGKSTLAYACLREGMRLVADDVAYFTSPARSRHAWGQPACLYLMPDAPLLFPELACAERVCRLNGEEKLRISVNTAFPGSAINGHRIDAVVVLRRAGGRAARIEEACREEIIQALAGFRGDLPLDRNAMVETARRIADLPSGCLIAGDDPRQAARCLMPWLHTVA